MNKIFKWIRLNEDRQCSKTWKMWSMRREPECNIFNDESDEVAICKRKHNLQIRLCSVMDSGSSDLYVYVFYHFLQISLRPLNILKKFTTKIIFWNSGSKYTYDTIWIYCTIMKCVQYEYIQKAVTPQMCNIPRYFITKQSREI